jgi:hypothetical protein
MKAASGDAFRPFAADGFRPGSEPSMTGVCQGRFGAWAFRPITAGRVRSGSIKRLSREHARRRRSAETGHLRTRPNFRAIAGLHHRQASVVGHADENQRPVWAPICD